MAEVTGRCHRLAIAGYSSLTTRSLADCPTLIGVADDGTELPKQESDQLMTKKTKAQRSDEFKPGTKADMAKHGENLSDEERTALNARNKVVKLNAIEVNLGKELHLESLKPIARLKGKTTPPDAIIAETDADASTEAQSRAKACGRYFADAWKSVAEVIDAADNAREQVSQLPIMLARYASRMLTDSDAGITGRLDLFNKWAETAGKEILAAFEVPTQVGTYTEQMRSIKAGKTWLEYASVCRQALKNKVELDRKITGFEDYLYATIRDLRIVNSAVKTGKIQKGVDAKAAESEGSDDIGALIGAGLPDIIHAQMSRLANTLNRIDYVKQVKATGALTVLLTKVNKWAELIEHGKFGGAEAKADEIDSDMIALEVAQHKAQTEEMVETATK